jgi:hypothetical protein
MSVSPLPSRVSPLPSRVSPLPTFSNVAFCVARWRLSPLPSPHACVPVAVSSPLPSRGRVSRCLLRACVPDWPVYLGGKDRDLYSSLEQINRGNVSNWKLRGPTRRECGRVSGEQPDRGRRALHADPTRKVIALDAATGDELWQWDPANEHTGPGSPRQRGLVYWANENGGEQRLFTGVNGFLLR